MRLRARTLGVGLAVVATAVSLTAGPASGALVAATRRTHIALDEIALQVGRQPEGITSGPGAPAPASSTTS